MTSISILLRCVEFWRNLTGMVDIRETEKRLATQMHIGLFGYLKATLGFSKGQQMESLRSPLNLSTSLKHHWNLHFDGNSALKFLHLMWKRYSCILNSAEAAVPTASPKCSPRLWAQHPLDLPVNGDERDEIKGWELLFSQSNLLAKLWHAVYKKVQTKNFHFQQIIGHSWKRKMCPPQTVKFQTFYPTFVVHVAHPACLRHCGQSLPKNRRC